MKFSVPFIVGHSSRALALTASLLLSLTGCDSGPVKSTATTTDANVQVPPIDSTTAMTLTGPDTLMRQDFDELKAWGMENDRLVLDPKDKEKLHWCTTVGERTDSSLVFTQMVSTMVPIKTTHFTAASLTVTGRFWAPSTSKVKLVCQIVRPVGFLGKAGIVRTKTEIATHEKDVVDMIDNYKGWTGTVNPLKISLGEEPLEPSTIIKIYLKWVKPVAPAPATPVYADNLMVILQ